MIQSDKRKLATQLPHFLRQFIDYVEFLTRKERREWHDDAIHELWYWLLTWDATGELRKLDVIKIKSRLRRYHKAFVKRQRNHGIKGCPDVYDTAEFERQMFQDNYKRIETGRGVCYYRDLYGK